MLRKIIILLAVLSISSCYDDFDNTVVVESEEQHKTTMDTDVTGKIVNVSAEEIANYTLEIGTNSIVSGKVAFYGHLEKATKKGQLVKLFENEKWVGAANLLLLENDINFFEISPFPNLRTVKYSSDELQNLQIDQKVDFRIEGGAFVRPAGEDYNGEVDIQYTLTNDAQSLNQIGRLGYADDKMVVTQNHAVIFIDIKGGGEILSQKPQMSSMIITDSEYEGMSLFRLDDQGHLILVKSNLRQNEEIPFYKGGVFVIADYKEGVYSEGTIIKNVNKVSYLPFEVEGTRSFSTLEGRWAKVLPQSENIGVDILSPCKDLIEVQNLEVKATEDKTYEIILEDTEDLIYNVKTKIINCKGEIEEIQAINIASDNNSFIYVFNQGEIDTWLPICKSDFEIASVNSSFDEVLSSIHWSVDINDELTILSGCEDHDNGFGYVVINGEENVYPSFEIVSTSTTTSIKSSTQNLRIHFDGLVQREYEVNEVRIFIDDPDFGANGYAISCENSALGCGIQEFNVTHFESLNDGWLRVSFSGVLWAQTISPPIAGNYPIEGVILSKIN